MERKYSREKKKKKKKKTSSRNCELVNKVRSPFSLCALTNFRGFLPVKSSSFLWKSYLLPNSIHPNLIPDLFLLVFFCFYDKLRFEYHARRPEKKKKPEAIYKTGDSCSSAYNLFKVSGLRRRISGSGKNSLHNGYVAPGSFQTSLMMQWLF